MTNATTNLIYRPYGQGGRDIDLPVDGGAHIYEGTLVSQLTATAMLCPGSTASSGPAVGVATHEVDNTDGDDGDLRCRVHTGKIFSYPNGTSTDACSEATKLFSVVYMGDDHTIFDNSAGSTLQPAGRFMGMNEDGTVRVFVGVGDLADIPVTDAVSISIDDAGTFTAAADVEAALAELYQDAKSIQTFVPIPLGDFVIASTGVGATVVAFNDGVADGPDYIEGVAYRFNVASTAKIAATIALPPDLDATADIAVKALASRVGALDTTVVLTLEAFFQTAGALYDADANAGGNTGVIAGATKEVAEVSLTILGADVPAAPCALSITIVPSAALDADDLRLHAVWVEYKRTVRTS